MRTTIPSRPTILGLTILISLNSSPAALGQPQPVPVDPRLARLPISSMLYDLAGRADGLKAAGPELVDQLRGRGFLARESGLVNVEIVNRRGDVPVSASLIEAHGGRIDAVWRGQTSAWLPPGRAVDLAEALPAGYFLRHANLAVDNNEGPVAIGSNTYADPLPAGSGMTVGIIDRNFMRLGEAEALGLVPIATRHNYPGGDFEGTFSVHGTAHLETVFDHVPLADFHLFKIANSTHLGIAMDDALALGVNVLSATQSFYNEGWPDNSGAAAQAAYHAATNGILYVSSSGNRGETHWQGPFTDSVFVGWLDWGGGDWLNDLGTVQDSTRVQLYMQWDRYSGGPNYDLYLYDTNSNILASSTTGGNGFEQISWMNVSGQPVDVGIAAYHVSGTRVELEVFEIEGRVFEHQVPESSLTSPNNNTAANCLVIGAVPHTTYSDGNLTGYSSRGPTNSGARGIDLVGPTNTTTYAYAPNPYTGTSCSTPNVAGAAAALWASAPDLSATGVRYVLTHVAELYNDWGDPGPDSQYGYGGLRLPGYQVNTEWVDRWVANGAGSSELPWYFVSDAMAAGPTGARLLFLGGGYPETIVLDQARTLESVVEKAVLGADE